MKSPLYLLLFICDIPFSQVKTEKHFYDNEFIYMGVRNQVDSLLAHYIDYYIYIDTIQRNGKIRTITADGKINYEGEYSNINNRIRDGLSKYYFDNGQLKSSAFYIDNELDGELISYYSSGQLKRKDNFKKGKFIKGNCYSTTGNDTAHFDFERRPQFPGGDNNMFKFINEHVKYPFEAKERGIQGNVIVQFMVDPDGELDKIKIVGSVHPLLDQEVIRIINKMPNWSPGIIDGKPVSVMFTVPIRFKLD
jgi:TonB family protein